MDRRAIIAGIAVAGTLLMAGAGCGAFALFERFVDFRPAARELPAAVRAYRAAGLPWTAGEVVPEPPPKPEENAAPLLRKGAAAMEAGKWPARYRDLQKSADAGYWDEVAKGLAPFAPALATLTAASERPRADFGRDWDLGSGLNFPEFKGLKGGLQALCLRGALHASRGERDPALADLVVALRLAYLASSDPVLLALFVRIAGEEAVYDAMRRAAAKDPTLAPALITEIEHPAPPLDFIRGLRGEAYFGVALTRNLDLNSPGDDAPPPDPRMLRRDGLPPSLTSRAFMTRSLSYWTRVADAVRRHPKSPTAIGTEMTRISDEENEKTGVTHYLDAMLAPSFGSGANSVARAETQRGVTLAYLRALDARRRTGAFPNPLVSGSDPFGRPYRARRTGEGFRIWSLGPDGKDGGGISRAEGRGPGARTDDVVAVFPPLPRRP